MCGLIITSLKSVNFNQNKKTWKTLAILMMIMMSLITMIWWSECNRCLRHFRGPWSLRLSRGGGARWPVVTTHYFQTTTDKLFISCPAMMTSHQIVISQMVSVIMTSSPVNRNSWASFYGAATEPVVTDMRMTNPAVSILRVFKLALRFFR